MSNASSAVRKPLVLVALAAVFSAPGVARAQIFIPFPFFTPIAECGKVGFVPSTFFEGEECKVWFAGSGGAYIVAGLEPFDEGDEVFVDGLICNTCLTTCLAGAIFNATVTPGCDGRTPAAAGGNIVLPNEAELHALTGAEDFFLTGVEFGVLDEQVVITRAGVNFDEPRTFNKAAFAVQSDAPIMVPADGRVEATLDHGAVTPAAGPVGPAGISRADDAVSASGIAGATEPQSAAAGPKPPFDCSSCLGSFCGGTLHCVLVDCDTYCNYVCTWVICESE